MFASPRRSANTSAGALARLRLLLLVPTLICCVLTVVEIAGFSSGGMPVRIAGALAAVLLAVYWTAGARKARFGALAEIPEALALLLVLLAAPGHPPLPLFATTFRALYGGRVQSALRIVVWVAAVGATDMIRGDLDVQDQLGRGIGLLLAGALMQFIVYVLARLNGTELRLRALLEHSTDVVTIVGKDRLIRWQAESIRAVLGFDPERLRGTSFIALIHPEDAAQVEALLGPDAPAPGDALPAAVRMRDSRGAYRHVEAVIGNQLHDEDIRGFLLTIRDVTERHRLEAERRALRDERAFDDAARLELQRLREGVEAQRQRQELEARLQRARSGWRASGCSPAGSHTTSTTSWPRSSTTPPW